MSKQENVKQNNMFGDSIINLMEEAIQDNFINELKECVVNCNYGKAAELYNKKYDTILTGHDMLAMTAKETGYEAFIKSLKGRNKIVDKRIKNYKK